MALLGRLGRRLLPLAVVLSALASVVVPRPAVAEPATQPPVSYISVDADRGCVLAAKNEHQPNLTVSTVKLLTALSALERVPLDSMVPVSERAANQPANKINMHAGEVWKFDDALHSLLIISANDAAFAIAERAGGTVENFAKETNETAKRLGAVDTTFGDPAGLDDGNSYAGGSKMSAYDLSVVARNVLATPEIANTSKLLTYDFTDPTGAGRHLVNHNKGFLTTYAGATGLKTGFTDRASRTLVTSATRNGRTMIVVVMGTWDDTGWAGFLLDQAFASPTTPCSGATVPPVRAVTVDARLAAFKGLPGALGSGRDVAATSSSGTQVKAATTTPTHAATTETTKPTPSTTRSRAEVTSKQASAATTAGTASSGSTLGFLNLRNLVIAVVLVLLILFLLRRRAVRRQRVRRMARQKRMAEIQRRRMIDVVDPAEVVDEVSHVKVVPAQRDVV